MEGVKTRLTQPTRNVLLGKTLKNDDPRIVFYDTSSKKHVLTFNAYAESGKEFKNDDKKKDDKTITLKVKKTDVNDDLGNTRRAMEFRIKIGDTKEKICSVHKYLDAYTMAKETDKWKDNTLEGLKLRKKSPSDDVFTSANAGSIHKSLIGSVMVLKEPVQVNDMGYDANGKNVTDTKDGPLYGVISIESGCDNTLNKGDVNNDVRLHLSLTKTKFGTSGVDKDHSENGIYLKYNSTTKKYENMPNAGGEKAIFKVEFKNGKISFNSEEEKDAMGFTPKDITKEKQDIKKVDLSENVVDGKLSEDHIGTKLFCKNKAGNPVVLSVIGPAPACEEAPAPVAVVEEESTSTMGDTFAAPTPTPTQDWFSEMAGWRRRLLKEDDATFLKSMNNLHEEMYSIMKKKAAMNPKKQNERSVPDSSCNLTKKFNEVVDINIQLINIIKQNLL